MYTLKLVFVALSLLRCSGEVKTQHVVETSDETVSGCDDYVAYHNGSGWPPIVLSAPHGGYLTPPVIPDRDAGCWLATEARCEYTHTCGTKDVTRCGVITEGDLYTYELTMEVRNNLCKLFGGLCPATVYNNLERVKFDANRDLPSATFNVREAVCAFHKYKADIDHAKSVITHHNQVGLFIDVHGHGHRIQRAELGYLIRGESLDSGEPLLANSTSVRRLAERRSTTEFDALLRGNISFGALLELYGFSAVPSPTNPGPGSGNPYFNGGYLTREHGSRSGGAIDAIQIESARSFREPSTRGRYAKALACALRDFICMYYLPEGDGQYTQPVPGCSEDYGSFCSGQLSVYRQLSISLLWISLLTTLVFCAYF